MSAGLLLLVALFVGQPLLAAGERRSATPARSRLLEKKEELLSRIRAIDFEFETGILPEQLHQRQRAELMAEAAEVVREIQSESEQSAEIESAARFTDIVAAPVGVVDDIEAAIAGKRSGSAVSTRVDIDDEEAFCSECGKAIETEDKFCAFCGHRSRRSQ